MIFIFVLFALFVANPLVPWVGRDRWARREYVSVRPAVAPYLHA